MISQLLENVYEKTELLHYIIVIKKSQQFKFIYFVFIFHTIVFIVSKFILLFSSLSKYVK